MAQPQYTQGHHASVTRSHASRTAEKDAAFLLPYLKPHMKILDVGCGPGTITSGFCRYVPEGSVIGVDNSSAVIDQARSLHPAKDGGPQNLTFATADLMNLPFPAASFDLIFANQVLTHLSNPTGALREMKRVCKPAGLVASRDGVMPFQWYPLTPGLQLWNKYMDAMVRLGGADPLGSGSGKAMPKNARLAGFESGKMKCSGSVTVYAGEEERRWWGGLHAERVERSEVGEKFRRCGAGEGVIGEIVGALREWAGDGDGWFGVLQAEMICWV